ncbi:MAG: PTS fructose transporter subunit IIA [Bacilli bacterium]|uniref:PTS sugar transporter subunit IIA n=1 Tax=Anaerorhabdus sp. TaxID=1872524 RepID=UPI002FC8145C
MKFIIATHGNLADGYLSSIKILTNKENVFAINAYVENGVDVDDYLKKIINSFDEDEEIIIFTDIICGSLTQCVSKYLKTSRIKCITGINLPLVLEFILTNEKIDDAFIEKKIDEAKQQIKYINNLV